MLPTLLLKLLNFNFRFYCGNLVLVLKVQSVRPQALLPRSPAKLFQSLLMLTLTAWHPDARELTARDWDRVVLGTGGAAGRTGSAQPTPVQHGAHTGPGATMQAQAAGKGQPDQSRAPLPAPLGS